MQSKEYSKPEQLKEKILKLQSIFNICRDKGFRPPCKAHPTVPRRTLIIGLTPTANTNVLGDPAGGFTNLTQVVCQSITFTTAHQKLVLGIRPNAFFNVFTQQGPV